MISNLGEERNREMRGKIQNLKSTKPPPQSNTQWTIKRSSGSSGSENEHTLTNGHDDLSNKLAAYSKASVYNIIISPLPSGQ